MTSPMTICPLRLGHRPTEASLYSWSITSLSNPLSSMYPPRRPHSP